MAAAPTGEKLTVLSYHEIADPDKALIPEYAVTPTMFVRQIDWLRNNGYHFVGVDDVLADQAGRSHLPEKAVLLTFDDGYRSVYDFAWPLLKMLRIPSVVAVVGSWEEDSAQVNFDGHEIPRDKLMSWQQLRELSESGLVDIGSHSYDLHRGIPGNPEGNLQPAATTRLWNSSTGKYEQEADYRRRVVSDLQRSRDVIRKRVGRAPRVIAWPYGRYTSELRDAANGLGMTIGLTLDDGANMDDTPLSRLRRILVSRNLQLWELNREITFRNQNLSDNDRAQKVMHVDLDYIYDADPAQQERNLGHLLDRIVSLGVTSVYLQAFSDPDGDGSADAVYFPNRHVPMRSDLFNRVAWQISTRTQVRRVYAWMPMLAWKLPANAPGAQDSVVSLPSESSDHVNMGYARLSPFSSRARQTIREIYQDLARNATFEGLLFHDDVILSDYEDASEFAIKAYKDWGLPGSIAEIRRSDDLVGRWTILKINALDQFARELADVVRAEEPALKTARNMYARVVLSPKAEVWYSQALENSLANYDFTAIMAMPLMENASDPAEFYRALVARIKDIPGAMKKVVFEIQTVDWRQDSKPIPSDEIGATITSLYGMGVEHVAYYPDMLFDNHPNWSVIRKSLSIKPDVPQTQ
ncbi:MAG: poly-beta-1,6-N-acetyl-D-glucosamine N-deacetylase PgaB [Steroidobacteraceae bacterium]